MIYKLSKMFWTMWGLTSKMHTSDVLRHGVVAIDYIEKNFDVIHYNELEFKRGNPICDFTCYRHSDQRFQNLSL